LGDAAGDVPVDGVAGFRAALIAGIGHTCYDRL
jgi:hypothetical protein